MPNFMDMADQIEKIKQQFLEENPGWMVLAARQDPALHKYVADETGLKELHASPKEYNVYEVRGIFHPKKFNSFKNELMTYPGLTAIAVHVKAKALYDEEKHAEARELSEVVHTLSGIDIHPGASVDPYVFIDHGTGTVIGETASVGEGTQMYHGTTLGNLSARNEEVTDAVTGQQKTARHPQIGRNVKISLGSQILGPNQIGDNVTIGPRVLIMNSTVGAGAKIGPGVRLFEDNIPEGAIVHARGVEVTNRPSGSNVTPEEKEAMHDFRRVRTVGMDKVRELYNQVMQQAEPNRFRPASL